MKLKFKIQPYQTNAVEAVVDCFAGQSKNDSLAYGADPGTSKLPNVYTDSLGNAVLELTKNKC